MRESSVWGLRAALATVLAVCAMALAATPAYAMSRPTWVRVDKLNISTPAADGRDSFVLQGVFNMPPATLESTDVTLNIDGYSAVIGAAQWKRAGTTSITGRNAGVAGQLTFWVGGSSKCMFKFTGSLQAIKGHLTNYPNLPVTLSIGADFVDSVTAVVTANPSESLYKLDTLRDSDGGSLFLVDRIIVTRNLKQTGRDKLVFQGTNYTDTPFDPATTPLYFGVGGVSFGVDAGEMQAPVHGNVIRFTKDLSATSKLYVTIDNRTGRYAITATNMDLSGVEANTGVTFDSANLGPFYWDYPLTLQENGAHTVFKY